MFEILCLLFNILDIFGVDLLGITWSFFFILVFMVRFPVIFLKFLEHVILYLINKSLNDTFIYVSKKIFGKLIEYGCKQYFE